MPESSRPQSFETPVRRRAFDEALIRSSIHEALLRSSFNEALLRSSVALAVLLVMAFSLGGCESLGREKPTDFEAQQDASDAYLAYARGDCTTALRLTRPNALVAWEAGEILDSMRLIHGYCQELEGDLEDAQETYDGLLPNTAVSFAARDARERARILRVQTSDPDMARWMNEARARAVEASQEGLKASGARNRRVAVERRVAAYPPAARAAGIEGYAVVEFRVTPRGETADPVVVDSSPPFVFDGAAIRAIRRWRYQPKPSVANNDFELIRLVFLANSPEASAEDVDAPAAPSSN